MNDLDGPRRFRPYPAYRNSGIEWLGDIPAHWEVRRLKSIADVRLSNVDKKSVLGEEPVRLCNYVDVYYNDYITGDIEFQIATGTSDQVKRFSLRAGDVLITKDSESWTDIAVSAVVREDLPDVLCGYHLALVRPTNGNVGAFLARAFSARGPRDQFEVAANGITRSGLGADAICTGVFAVPPIEEQKAIAAFLDRETARIDDLVARKTRLIELLQEHRGALITRAVTRGLHPNVPLKDSGVEWLGLIPSHWEALALARVTTSRCDGPFGSGLKSEHYASEGVRVIRLQNIGWAEFADADKAYLSVAYADQLKGHGVLEGDLLVAGLGDEGHPVGRACVAPLVIEPAMVKADCFRFRLNRSRILPEFAAYQLSVTASASAGALATGATRLRMNLSVTAARMIALPPIDEQCAIVAALDADRRRFDDLAEAVFRALGGLEEMRAALISSAVTGRMDVRNVSA